MSSIKVSVEGQWKIFKSQVMMPMQPEQEAFVRKIFYSGFFDAMRVLREVVGSPGLSEKEGVEILDSLFDESLELITKEAHQLMKDKELK